MCGGGGGNKGMERKGSGLGLCGGNEQFKEGRKRKKLRGDVIPCSCGYGNILFLAISACVVATLDQTLHGGAVECNRWQPQCWQKWLEMTHFHYHCGHRRLHATVLADPGERELRQRQQQEWAISGHFCHSLRLYSPLCLSQARRSFTPLS